MSDLDALIERLRGESRDGNNCWSARDAMWEAAEALTALRGENLDLHRHNDRQAGTIDSLKAENESLDIARKQGHADAEEAEAEAERLQAYLHEYEGIYPEAHGSHIASLKAEIARLKEWLTGIADNPDVAGCALAEIARAALASSEGK